MNLRRLMQNPSRTKPTKGPRCASQQNWSAEDRYGSIASYRAPRKLRGMSALVRKRRLTGVHDNRFRDTAGSSASVPGLSPDDIGP